jgi:3-oxoacyl-[acyl-carrier protein] reductase
MSDPGASLAGEVALVTGASRGIGRAIAAALGRAGATVVGTATTEAGAAAIGGHLAEAGLAGEGMVLDVTRTDSVAALLEAVTGRHGTPGVLVNNAGITRDNLLVRMKDEEWDAVIDTNLSALYRMCRACMKGMMKARRGRIVNITSVVGATGNAGQTNYAAAKAGVIGFTRSLAREAAPRGITVNAVAPGFIETDMTAALGEEQRAALQAQIPLGRLGSVEDVAAAVAYLASPAAAYVTGATIHVNGGMHMA